MLNTQVRFRPLLRNMERLVGRIDQDAGADISGCLEAMPILIATLSSVPSVDTSTQDTFSHSRSARTVRISNRYCDTEPEILRHPCDIPSLPFVSIGCRMDQAS
jgi:hypothetical protein